MTITERKLITRLAAERYALYCENLRLRDENESLKQQLEDAIPTQVVSFDDFIHALVGGVQDAKR